jgi:hypothetical protein
VQSPIALTILVFAGILFVASLLLMRRTNLRLRHVQTTALE